LFIEFKKKDKKMAQGRKRIPDEIKRRRGTLRKDRVNENQPKIGRISARPPDILDERAIGEWNKYVTSLGNAGVLKQTDSDMLAIMCNDIKDYKRYCVKIKAQGEIVKGKLSIFVKLKNEARKRIFEGAALFGIDPASRQKMVAEVEAEKTELEKIMEMC
jgi:P27 family predicted phage terminase small subunit